MKKNIILFTIFAVHCNYFSSAERGTSPWAKMFQDRTLNSVVSVYPKDKSSGSYLNTNIFIVFSKAVSGFDSSNFTVSSDGGKTNQSGKITLSDKVLVFDADSNYIANTAYTVTAKASGGLSADYVFTFTAGNAVDTVPPYVASTNPPTGDTNMPINIAVSATFNEAVDPSTVNSNVFTVSGVTGTVTITDQTAAFKSSSNLPINTTLTATVKTGVKDMAGNTMTAPYSWTFTTGSSVAGSCRYDLSIYDTCLIGE